MILKKHLIKYLKKSWYIVHGTWYLMLCTLLFSCKSDKPEPIPQTLVTVSTDKGVFIVNEGNFQFGNASVSYYNAENGAVVEDYYKTINNKQLGDVCQSMFFGDGKAYIVVNNSKKIEILDSETFVNVGTIQGFNSPRYMVQVSKSKAYVSEIYSKKLAVVDLSSKNISKFIDINTEWAEQMAYCYGKVFVGTVENTKLFVVNAQSDVVTDSIELGYSPSSMVEDKNGKLWVLCGGSKTKSIKGKLVKIDPITLAIEKEFEFSDSETSASNLTINSTNDTLYFLKKGVYIVAINANSLPQNPVIVEGNKLFYGLGIEPKTGVIYVSDAIDYVQKGIVYRHKPNGELLNSFKVGIIPSGFYFR